MKIVNIMTQVYKNDFLVDNNSWYRISIFFTTNSNPKSILKIFNKDNTTQLFPVITFPNNIFVSSNSLEYNIYYFNKDDRIINIYGLGVKDGDRVTITKIDTISKYIDSNKVKDIPDISIALYYMKIFMKSGLHYDKLLDKYNILTSDIYVNSLLGKSKKDITLNVNGSKTILFIIDNLSYMYSWIHIVQLIMKSNSGYRFIFIGDKIKDIVGINFHRIKEYLNLDGYTISEYISIMDTLITDFIVKENIYCVFTNDIFISASLSRIGIQFVFLDNLGYNAISNKDVIDKISRITLDKAKLHITNKEQTGTNINKLYIPYSYDSYWQGSDKGSKNLKIRVGYIGFDTPSNTQNIKNLLKVISGKGYYISLILPEQINGKQFDNYKKNNTMTINVTSDYGTLIKYCKMIDVFIFMPDYNRVNIINVSGLRKPVICHSSFDIFNVLKYDNISEIPKLLDSINKNSLVTDYSILSDISLKDRYEHIFENI